MTVSFPSPKDPQDAAWYQVDFGETLDLIVSISVLPTTLDAQPSSADLQASQAQLTVDNKGVAFLASGGQPGMVYAIRVGVLTEGGSTLYGTALLSVSGPSQIAPASRTVSLPTDPSAFWQYLAWPSKSPQDSLNYSVDCAAWLQQSDEVLISAAVSRSSGLTVSQPSYGLSGNSRTSVTVAIGGGVPGSLSQVAFVLTFDSGRELAVTVWLEIRDGVAPGLVPVMSGGALITADAALTADSAITADA